MGFSKLLRKMIPVALSVMSLMGWLVSKALLTEDHVTWLEASLLAILCGALLVGFITWIAFVVDRSDALNAQLERRVAERTAALRESEGRLAGVIQSAMDAIITVDEQQRIVLFNTAAEEIFHCRAAEAMGRPVTRFIPLQFHAVSGGGGYQVDRSGIKKRFLGIKDALWAVRADGERFQIEASVSQVETTGKKGFTVILRDVTEGRQAEEALRESEERFRALVTASSGVVYRMSPDWSEMRQLRGKNFLADSEAPNRNWLQEYIHPDDQARVMAAIHEAIRAKSIFELEHHVLRADSSLGWTFSRAIPLQDANGEIVEWFGAATDVTERKQAEEVRERLAAVVDSSDDAIISKTLEGTITSWNSGAEKVFGYSASEAVGKPMLMLFPPGHVNEESDILARIGRGESVDHFETVRIRKDGQPIHVSATISPIKDSSGAIIGASKIARDITARTEAERQLTWQAEELSQQAEDLARSRAALETQALMLQSVLDSISEGLVVADEQEKFVVWNPAAERILGFGPTKLPSKEWPAHYGFFLPDTVTPLLPEQDPLIRALHGEVCTAEMFVRNPKTPAGAWIEASGAPLKDQGGALRGGVVAFRDITQQKAAEREIRMLNEDLELRVIERTSQLEAANQELEAFSYSVSHDLRAPLRHISGFSQLLMEEFAPALDREAQRYVERIQAGTQKMGLLVDELLNLARVGRQALNLQASNLNGMVAEVVAMLQPDCDGRQVKWAIGDLPVVDCDPVLVKQVFQNLLANALKFTRHRAFAVIEIGQKDEDGQLALSVRDNGTGFDMKYVDKLFGVFQRLHRTEDFEGTGIGLATVQRIVHKHGGRVWAEGELDKGAAFYFTLSSGKSAGKQMCTNRNGATAGG